MRPEAHGGKPHLAPTLLFGLNMDTLFWLINAQTLGGLGVVGVSGVALVIYFSLLRWIIADAQGADEGGREE